MALDVLNVTPEPDLTADTTESTIGAPVKSAAPTKGGVAPVGTTALNPKQTAELLANMQQMIDQKTGVYAGIMSGLQDALAYATPQDQLPLALQYRNQQKRQEQEDIFGMRQQMAALQASSQQAQAQREAMNKILGGGGSGGQQGGAGVQADVFGGAEIPPEIRQAIAMDPVNGPAILQKYLTTAAGERNKAKLNPAWYELTEVVGADGQIMKVPRIQAVELAMQNPSNPKNRAVIKSSSELQTTAAGAPQLRPQGTAEDIARGLGVPLTSGTRTAQRQGELYTQSQQPGYTGPVVAKPETSRHVTGDAIDVDMKRATPEQIQALRDNGFRQTVKSEPWHWELPRTQGVPTQVAGPAQVTAGGPPRAMPGESVDSLKQRQELWKKQQETNIGTAAKSGEESRKKAGDMISAIESNAKNADEVIRTADRVIQHATKHPKEFGYSYQQENPVLAGAANIPGVGAVVEKAVPAMFGAPGESSRRATTNSDAQKLGLDFAAQMFSGTGARLGVGLEQMAANAKGVGTELPAETNALNANLVKVAAEKAREQAAAWRTWRDSHGGDNADPYDFIQSKENKHIIEKYDRKLDAFEEEAKRIYPQFFGERKQTTKENRKPLDAILGG